MCIIYFRFLTINLLHHRYNVFCVRVIFDPVMYGVPLSVKNTFCKMIYEVILVSENFCKIVQLFLISLTLLD